MSAYKCLDPELIEIGTEYAFTVNPSDFHQYWQCNSGHRVENFVHKSRQLLIRMLAPHAQYRMRLEISKGGRLHYHGYISFNSKAQIRDFFVTVIHKLQSFCTYDLHQIKDLRTDGSSFKGTWKQYVNKQSFWKIWIKDTDDEEPLCKGDFHKKALSKDILTLL